MKDLKIATYKGDGAMGQFDPHVEVEGCEFDLSFKSKLSPFSMPAGLKVVGRIEDGEFVALRPMKHYLVCSPYGFYAYGCCDEEGVENIKRQESSPVFIEINRHDWMKLTDNETYPEYDGQEGINKIYKKYTS